MDSVVDKGQILSEGHSEVEDRNLDLEDFTDNEEVELNLPREGAGERTHRGRRSEICRGPPLRGRR